MRFDRRALAVLLAALLGGCGVPSGNNESTASAELVAPEILKQHDYALADTPNKRTALAYLYTAWNDGRIAEARAAYWVPGSFPAAPAGGPPADLPANVGSPRYTVKKVIEEGDHVVVLSLVEGVGIGEEITTIFGTPGGTKIGDAVVEIFRFDEQGRIAEKWDTIQPISEQDYDFR